MNISQIKEIAVAILSNPKFFNDKDSTETKIQQACNLVEMLDKTIK